MNNRTDVCYVISFGFAARMLLQTGLINRLLAEGKTIAIITPDPNDANLQQFEGHPNLRVYLADIPTTIWSEDYLFKRKYYLEDIKANPALWEKHVYSLWYSTSKHPWRRVRPLYYLLIYHLIRFFPGIRRRFLRREGRYLASDQMRSLLQSIRPRLLVTTYPVSIIEAQLLYEAQKSKIPSLLHLLSWDNITSKGRFPVIADYYMLWGPIMQQELKEYYDIDNDKISVCGVPHFDQYFPFKGGTAHQELLEIIGLDPQAPYLFFAMSAQRFSPYEIDIVEGLAKAIEDKQLGNKTQLIIRPHPQNMQGNMASQSWLKRLRALKSERVAIDSPRLLESNLRWSLQQNDMTYLAKLLAGCSICLNSGSTISIEALLLDKPVIITSFDANFKLPYWKSARRLIDYTHLAKVIALGGITVVRSFEELFQWIPTYLDHPAYLHQERQYTAQQECYQLDGKATERAVAAIGATLKSL
jgi:hypothetical protein